MDKTLKFRDLRRIIVPKPDARTKTKIKKCKGGQCSGTLIGKELKLCDWCLLRKFNLKASFDSEDLYSMSPVYDEEDVLAALRKATKL